MERSWEVIDAQVQSEQVWISNANFYYSKSGLKTQKWLCPDFEYSNHLNTGKVWYLNGTNMSGCRTIEWWSENRTKMSVFL